MTRVFFYTLGCRLNQAETVVLEDIFRDKGFDVSGSMASADVVVINSCTVTEAGDSDARRLINRIRRTNPAARIALVGCQAQVQKDKLLQLPGIMWVVGTGAKMRLADIIQEGASRGPRVVIPPIKRGFFVMPVTSGTMAGRRTRANLKVQDGCDNFCAYCEVPYARGRARSREFSDVIRGAEALVRAGHKEIVLTGIDLGAYHHRGRSLLDVVQALQVIPGLERIRISSIEQTTLPLQLTKYMFPKGKLCRFLHVPLQSGSDRILKRMGRKYLTEDFSRMVKAVVKKVPGIMVGTDVIVGFPGETEDDFQKTRELLERLPIHYFHVFSYSHRHRARSRNFQGAVASDVIVQRSAVLRQLSHIKRRQFFESLVGTRQVVLVEQKKDGCWQGHTDNFVLVKFRSPAELRNCLVEVRLNSITGDSMMGAL